MSGMQPFTRLMPFEDALQKALDTIRPISRVEKVDLDRSNGRVVATDVKSPIDVPRFDRAAMDGYAVRASDTFGASRTEPRRLRVVARLSASDVLERPISEGECTQISTGSMIPPGADAVVMAEYAEEHDGFVEIIRPIYPSGNVSLKGRDISKGQVVVSKGRQITPSTIGALAAVGLTDVQVYEKPKIAVVPTGSEIVDISSRPGKGQIFDINTHTVSAVIAENGCEPVRLPIVPDEEDEISKALSQALRYDMVVLSGGSSVGERDVMFSVLGSAGDVLFHGVQVKPGKPTLFAVVQGKPVFSMPGHPTSCLSNAYLFLEPCIRKLARLPPKRKQVVTARMAKRLTFTLGRKQFVTVQLRNGLVHLAFKESSAITSMSMADGYIVVPENVESIEEGQEVEVTLL